MWNCLLIHLQDFSTFVNLICPILGIFCPIPLPHSLVQSYLSLYCTLSSPSLLLSFEPCPSRSASASHFSFKGVIPQFLQTYLATDVVVRVPTLRRSEISGDSSARANCSRALFLFSIWSFFLFTESHRTKGITKNEPAYTCNRQWPMLIANRRKHEFDKTKSHLK